MKEIISLEKFIPLLTEHPAVFLKVGKRKGYLKVGYDADLVIWQPAEKFKVLEENILHRHKASPYIGHELFGSIQQTIVNGQIVFKDGRVVSGGKKYGEIILASR